MTVGKEACVYQRPEEREEEERSLHSGGQNPTERVWWGRPDGQLESRHHHTINIAARGPKEWMELWEIHKMPSRERVLTGSLEITNPHKCTCLLRPGPFPYAPVPGQSYRLNMVIYLSNRLSIYLGNVMFTPEIQGRFNFEGKLLM